MATPLFADGVKVFCATTGTTSPLALGAAVGGFRSAAGLVNGATYNYAIWDGPNYEVGQGVYSTSGPTITRALIYASSNSGAAINLSGSAWVIVGTVLAADLAPTGSGDLVRSVSPTLTTPNIGNATGGNLTLSGLTGVTTSGNYNTLNGYLFIGGTSNSATLFADKSVIAGDAGFKIRVAGADRWACGEFNSSVTNTNEFYLHRTGIGFAWRVNDTTLATAFGGALTVSNTADATRFTATTGGSASTPAFRFNGMTGGAGFYQQGPTQFGVAINSVAVAGFYSAGFFVNPTYRISPNGGNEYLISNNSGEFDVYAGAQHAMRWTPTAVEARKLLDLQSGQIKFPATQAPSVDANTLDDYEEGTFTPGITFDGVSTGVTFGYRQATYTKWGNRVVADIYMELTSKGSATGSANITGLPFAVASDAFGAQGGLGRFFNTVAPNVFVPIQGSTAVSLINIEGATETTLSDANFTNSTQIRVTLVYRTA